MRALAASEFLRIWELGAGQSGPRRALTLLEAGFPESPPAALGRLSVGGRDDLLFQMRAAAFGANLEAITGCPRCHERLELSFPSDQLLQPSTIDLSGEGLIAFNHDDYSLSLRLPDALDLVEAASLTNPGDAEEYLIRRSIVSASKSGQPVAQTELPESVVAGLSSRLANADPRANVELSLCCPGCQQHWNESFDICAFFWREIEALSARLLREVHTLAAAYGWSEAEIMALSPGRRRSYLELVAEMAE